MSAPVIIPPGTTEASEVVVNIADFAVASGDTVLVTAGLARRPLGRSSESTNITTPRWRPRLTHCSRNPNS